MPPLKLSILIHFFIFTEIFIDAFIALCDVEYVDNFKRKIINFLHYAQAPLTVVKGNFHYWAKRVGGGWGRGVEAGNWLFRKC